MHLADRKRRFESHAPPGSIIDKPVAFCHRYENMSAEISVHWMHSIFHHLAFLHPADSTHTQLKWKISKTVLYRGCQITSPPRGLTCPRNSPETTGGG